MSDNYFQNSLDSTAAQLLQLGFDAMLLRKMEDEKENINQQLKNEVGAKVAAFFESANPDILPQLSTHAQEHTESILSILRASHRSNFDYVRRHAQLRARQFFPLEPILHAYRCGHRVFANWLHQTATAHCKDAQQAVGLTADFCMEYTDVVSTILTVEYAAEAQRLAEIAGDQRAMLFSYLLQGYDESDHRITRSLADAGYLDQRQSFCIAMCQSADAREMQSPERVRRIIDSMSQTLKIQPWRKLLDVHNNKVVLIASHLRRQSGWTAEQSPLSGKLASALLALGPSVLVGISRDVPSTSHLPAAANEALLALELASSGERVQTFEQIPRQQMLLHLAGEEMQRMLPHWASEFELADKRSKHALSQTLQAYADCDLNALRTADKLIVHPNTLYARFSRIEKISGLDPKRFHHLTELLLVSEMLR